MHAATLPQSEQRQGAFLISFFFFGGWLNCRGATFPFPVALLIETKTDDRSLECVCVCVCVCHCNPTKLFSFRLHADRRGLATVQ